MALLIEKEISILGGVIINQVYIRIGYSVDMNSNSVKINTKKYVSKDAYLKKERDNLNILDIIPDNQYFQYLRDIDGGDILMFANEKIKNIIISDVTGIRPLFDPSTNDPIIDPSTGLQTNETYIRVPKIAEEHEVLIVDIDDTSIG